MTRRRVLPLILALLLAVSIAAGVGAQTAGPLAKYDKPITISWAIQTAAASKLLDKDTWENNRWSRLIKDKLNIDLTVAFSADSMHRRLRDQAECRYSFRRPARTSSRRRT